MLLPDPVSHWILLLDIEDFSLRAESVQATLHSELYNAVEYALGRAGLTLADAAVQDRGDGMLILLPAQVKPGELLRQFPLGLHDALAALQERYRDDHRIRLRLGLHQGLVNLDGERWTSTAINDLARLVDAEPVKRVLSSAARAQLVLVVSEEVHKSVVAGRYPGIDPARYLPADFTTKHGEQRRGWVTVPGPDYPAPPGLLPVTGDPRSAVGEEPAERGRTEGKHVGAGLGDPAPTVRRNIRLKNGDYVEGDKVQGDKIVHLGADRPVQP